MWNAFLKFLGDDARSVAEVRPRYGRLAVVLLSLAIAAVIIAARGSVDWPVITGFIIAGSLIGGFFGGRGATIGVCLAVILGALLS